MVKSYITNETLELSYHHLVGDSKLTAWVTMRKVRMTTGRHGPYALGYTRVTMVNTKCRNIARLSKSQKINLSSDWRLQLASMK